MPRIPRIFVLFVNDLCLISGMHSTEGIIIKKENYGEADLLVTILTRDFGKIKVMAQGILKQEAKLKGHAEPLTHSAVSFVIGKNFYRLTSADAYNFFENMRSDINKLRVAYRIAGLIDANVYEEKGDSRLFKLIQETYLKLDQADVDEKVWLEKLFFEFNVGFLYIFGLLPSQKISVDSVKSILVEQVGFKYEAGFDIMGL